METGKLGNLLSSQLNLPIKVKHQPWYRERLDIKYNTSHKCTDTSSWTFIKDGLDDYRDGKPSKLDDSIVLKRKGMKTNLKSPNLHDGCKSSQRVKKSLNANEKYYLKAIPNQQRRIKRVEELENDICQGPLSDLQVKDDLPPNVLKDVQEILNLSCERTDEHPHTSPLNYAYRDADAESIISPSELSRSSSIVNVDVNPLQELNLYKKYSNTSSEDVPMTEEKEQNKSKNLLPSEMQVEVVTKDFCDWVKNIDGGPDNNIKEETIKELFVCAYEGGPTRSVVQTMNLSRVPSELLEDANVARNTCIRRNVASRGLHTCREDKIKYGAWYLDPKTWRARPANELLQAEKKHDEKPKPQAERDELDELLPSLHSAHTFYNFTEEKRYARKPEILRNFVNSMNDKHETDLPTITTN